jgi:hypothetical protein
VTGKIGDCISPTIFDWVQPKISGIAVTDVYGETHEKGFNIELPTAKNVMDSIYYPSTTISIASPADLLVIDSQNRRVGAFYENGAFVGMVNEIPGACYLGSQIRTGSSKTVYLPYSIGSFSIEIVGTGTGRYNMTIFTAVDQNLDGQIITEGGDIGLGQTINRSIHVGELGALSIAQPPVASFTESEYTASAGTPIDFDPSCSHDPDGRIDLYEWDWESDGVFEKTTISPIVVSKSYMSPGTYTVTLRVTDNDGLSNTSKAVITITPNLVIPEVPLGTLAALASTIFALAAYASIPRYRRKRQHCI